MDKVKTGIYPVFTYSQVLRIFRDIEIMVFIFPVILVTDFVGNSILSATLVFTRVLFYVCQAMAHI